jgi:hypothetical protein
VACLVIILVLIVIQSKKSGSRTQRQAKTMNQRILIKNTTIVNEGKSFIADVLMDGVIRQIGTIEIDPTYKLTEPVNTYYRNY